MLSKLKKIIIKRFCPYTTIKLLLGATLLASASSLLYFQFFLPVKFTTGVVDYKVAIIGSGVGGLTSAIYLAQLGIETVLIQGKEAGGALATTGWVENWPGEQKIMGADLIDKLLKHALACGVTVIPGEVIDCKVHKFPARMTVQNGMKLRNIRTYCVIIASGATPIKLKIPGEDFYWGKGVTTCAVCDAPLHKGKSVVVIGGGDSAMTEAQILAPLAQEVAVLIRNESRAKKPLLEAVKNLKNVRILYHAKPLQIIGEAGAVTGIEIDHKGERKTLGVSGVFLAIGSTPNVKLFSQYLKLDSDGLIKTDWKQRTSKQNVFAIGDVTNKDHRQAIVAAGQGCIAALECISFLNKHQLNTQKVTPRVKKPLASLDISQERALPSKSEEKEEKITSKKKDIINVRSLEALEEKINGSDLPVLVDFYATWCPPCKAMNPLIDNIALELSGKALVLKVNIDTVGDAATKYQVQGVPTFLIFKKGQEVERFVGYTSQEELTAALS